jgi:ATP adenylyltransferase
VPATEEGEERSRSLLVVHAREHAFVILNRFPYSNGHVLVVPRAHVADPSGLEDGAFRGLHDLLRDTVAAVRRAYRPEGLNVGMNLGRVAGAGIDAHIHYHVVPRWAGDTNFMPVLAGAKVVSEGLLDSYDKLKAVLG